MEVEGVGRRLGRRWAVRGVSLSLRPGDTVALIGPNGAGKTTLLGLLAGAAEPSEGRVRGVGGASGFVPQRPSLYRRLTARENLELFARLERVPRPVEAARDLLARSDLADVAERRVGSLSVGQQQRVNVAIGLLGRPDIVLLDEPSAALDPRQRRLLWQLLDEVRERRGAIVFTPPTLEEVRHADRVLVLSEGRPVFSGSVQSFTGEAGRAADGVEDAFVRVLDGLEPRAVPGPR